MCSVLVVIANVLAHQPFEMPFIQYDHLIQQISSTGAYPAFGDPILPWTAEAGSLRCDAKALHCFDNFLIKICGTIKDQITGHRLVRECLSQLLRYPLTRWVPGYIGVQDAAAVVRDDKEAMQHAKGERWDSEEIHRGDDFAVVVQEDFPLFRRFRVPRSFSHPPQNCSL